jgi:peroxiredoxin
MTVLEDTTTAAERRWLDVWTTGPTEEEGTGLAKGDAAPDLALPDHTGAIRQLSEFWADRPALIIFWRHFGCGCGIARAERLRAEWPDLVAAGLNPVIVAQGLPERAAAYRSEQDLPCPVLSEPEPGAYRAYGIGQWSVERVLYDAPPEFWSHSHDVGAAFQDHRRAGGRTPVDDPWRGVAEFVVGTDGRVRLCYAYQYCDDFPDPRVLTTAARLA